MKRIFGFIMIMACIAVPSVFAQGSVVGMVAGKNATTFEGVMNVEMSSHGQKIPMTETIKGSNIRIDMSMSGMAMANITDMATRKMTMLMPGMKMYMTKEMPDNKMVQSESVSKPVKTGKSETILGYKCEEWTCTDAKTKQVTSMWLAKGLGIPTTGGGGQMDRFLGSASAVFEPMFKDGGVYPLRIVGTDGSGAESFRMDVTKIDQKPVDASVFQVPSDYKQMAMPAGMGGMGDMDGEKSDK